MRAHQVLSITLDDPVSIAHFDNSGFAEHARIARVKAEELMTALNRIAIKFAVLDHNPPIEVLIASVDLLKLKRAHIKLPN